MRRLVRALGVGLTLGVVGALAVRAEPLAPMLREFGTAQPEPIEVCGRQVTTRQRTERLGDLAVPEGAAPYRDALCAATELSVIASVVGTEGRIVQVGRVRRVSTVLRLFVERVVTGESSPWIELEVGQGQLAGIWYNSGDLPAFAEGQRYLLLLETDLGGAPKIVASGRALVELDPQAPLPSSTKAATMWELGCRARLDVEQRPFPAIL